MSILGLHITRKVLKEHEAKKAGFDSLREGKAVERT